MFNKSVLVTGCDTGIGFGLCKSLPETGYFVIAGCKTQKGKEEVEKLFLDFKNRLENTNKQEKSEDSSKCVTPSGEQDTLPESVGFSTLLDVTSEESVNKLVSTYSEQNKLKRIPDLYAVVNNAAIWRFSSLEESCLNAYNTKEELERWRCVLDTNVLGYVRVTLAFIPLLKRYEGDYKPRIVFISSTLDRYAVLGQNSYVASKFAVRGFQEALMHEFSKTNLKFSSISPGGLSDTDLFTFDFDNYEIDKSYKLPETLILKNGLRGFTKMAGKKSGVVKTVIKALNSKNPKRFYRNTSGTLLFKLTGKLPKFLFIKLVRFVLFNFERLSGRYRLLDWLVHRLLQ